ncbi:hypothetical protein PR048_024971 [Dryococelus australis]|uniref:Uncharacterized protein n=1 Tax=Dryococelus australis TaxID=614101 RepID=A0ABQ9GQ19_9NEOP|nr:hypothetical protein PR048_024971 [Dryococelus australis]
MRVSVAHIAPSLLDLRRRLARSPTTKVSRVTPAFSHVGIVLDDAVGRRVFSGISRFPALSFRRRSLSLLRIMICRPWRLFPRPCVQFPHQHDKEPGEKNKWDVRQRVVTPSFETAGISLVKQVGHGFSGFRIKLWQGIPIGGDVDNYQPKSPTRKYSQHSDTKVGVVAYLGLPASDVYREGVKCGDIPAALNIEQRRNARTVETGDPRKKPADQQHLPARSPVTRIQERPRWEMNPLVEQASEAKQQTRLPERIRDVRTGREEGRGWSIKYKGPQRAHDIDNPFLWLSKSPLDSPALCRDPCERAVPPPPPFNSRFIPLNPIALLQRSSFVYSESADSTAVQLCYVVRCLETKDAESKCHGVPLISVGSELFDCRYGLLAKNVRLRTSVSPLLYMPMLPDWLSSRHCWFMSLITGNKTCILLGVTTERIACQLNQETLRLAIRFKSCTPIGWRAQHRVRMRGPFESSLSLPPTFNYARRKARTLVLQLDAAEEF